jgi:signal transduction histidine kinase
VREGGRASVHGATEVLTQIASAAADAGDLADDPAAAPAEMRLLRELCHDLIESAASIKLLAHAAGPDAVANPSLAHRLRMIATEAGRIADICGQVLNRPIRLEPVRLDVLAAEAADSARLRYSGTIEVVSAPVTLNIHPAVVVRILNNLLTNACRAAGRGGQVRLLVTRDADRATLSVADSGDGLGRGKAGRTTLGLEIIGSLVLGCGGTVQMGVSDLGGLCVTIALPCPQPACENGSPLP